jgi:hypothetical protein
MREAIGKVSFETARIYRHRVPIMVHSHGRGMPIMRRLRVSTAQELNAQVACKSQISR